MSKRQGGWQKADNDFYPTPAKAVVPLLRFVPEGARFYEPCAGAGDLIDHLAAHRRFCVGARDISPRNDFVARGSALDLVEPDLNGATVLITNPPHTHAVLAPIIERLRMLLPTWLLLPLDWNATVQAVPYMGFCSDIVMIGRIKFITDSKTTGFDNYAWCRFQAEEPRLTRFHPR